MDATLYRSAFNPIIAEARDACHGVYDAITGDTLVQGTKGLPIFVLLSMDDGCKWVAGWVNKK
jgi:N-methylhydantoinase B